jgi:hypothetical protein
MGKPIFTFPYRYKNIAEEKIFNPILTLPIKTKEGWLNTLFLLDSGADTTMLTLSMAKRLGLSFDSKKKTKLFGIGDLGVPAYPGKVVIKFKPYFELTLRCYYIDAEDSTLLLGRLDVFDKFNICFNSSTQQVIFQPK